MAPWKSLSGTILRGYADRKGMPGAGCQCCPSCKAGSDWLLSAPIGDAHRTYLIRESDANLRVQSVSESNFFIFFLRFILAYQFRFPLLPQHCSVVGRLDNPLEK